jgi:hypothetical protein
MDLLLPHGLKSLIRDRYLAGIADAQAKFDMSSADEDALSGALGNEISMAHSMTFSDGHRTYLYRTSYKKIRGRGPGAPEKRLGADGIFQIDVHDDRGERRKGLPFQAKKEWHGTDAKLFSQVHQMVETAGDGMVVDFRPGNYTGCTAMAAIQGQADRRIISAAGNMRTLGELLADDFLDCNIGKPGLFFDPATESWLGLTVPQAKPRHVITTKITDVRNVAPR